MRPRSVEPAQARVALFADVDGTLLDARDRLALSSHDIDAIRGQVELVLASSRTLVELAAIQRRLRLVAPVIAENGAVVAIPDRWRGSRTARRKVVAIGQPASRVRPRVRHCALQSGVAITDQRDDLPDRGRSIRRTHSVCVRNWHGAGAERFLRALKEDGLQASRSGAWITVTLGADKGVGVKTILALAALRGARYDSTAAIGNAANDAPLLAAAGLRFAIRNPRQGHAPELLAVEGVQPLSGSGQRAWRDTLAMILSTGRR